MLISFVLHLWLLSAEVQNGSAICDSLKRECVAAEWKEVAFLCDLELHRGLRKMPTPAHCRRLVNRHLIGRPKSGYNIHAQYIPCWMVPGK